MKANCFIKVLFISCLTACTLALDAQTPTRNYVDLTQAADQSVHAVVHIKTTFLYRTSVWEDFFGGSFWEDFFDFAMPGGIAEHQAMGAGSGVIIGSDGYIVTNNHVVEDAQDIVVTLNDKREFKATIVGTDPQTDLALIKIDAENLPSLSFGNSDEVRIGEWVLAVGNPFNLTSTVTAGIVSAKARNLGILGENTTVESFIQTDAAVNQGNSGGALVNASGELIGINSAIASGDGYFTGYSFAIPSNLARKIVDDLRKYGSVQRAVIGINVSEIDFERAQQLQLPKVQGLEIASVLAEGSAENAGLAAGDILTAIDGREINSVSELREVVSQYSPGDTISISYLRDGRQNTARAVLLNDMGTTDLQYNTND